MKKLTIIAIFFTAVCFSQNINGQGSSIFDISSDMRDFKIDTTSPPADRLTAKINELRNLRGGFNINEALEYKLKDERSKVANTEQIDQLSTFFKSGNGKKWLDNAVIWIYRKQFNYDEMKLLVKFYKTPAGQKMSKNFPLIMIQSLQAAEEIKKNFDKN